MEVVERMKNEDKLLLKRSWSVVNRNLNELALKIFEMIFEQSPDAKLLFPFMTKDGKKQDMEFHSLRFLQVIESAVQSIDNLSTIEPLLDNLGRMHGRLTESKGFRTHYWSVFVECTLYHFRKILAQDAYYTTPVLDKTMIAWRLLLRTIIRRMKTGLEQDLLNRQAHRNLGIGIVLRRSSSLCLLSVASANSPLSESSGQQ